MKYNTENTHSSEKKKGRALGGYKVIRREEDKRLLLDSQAEKLLRIQETNISIFGEVMRGQYSYFPLFLTNPFLLSQPQGAKLLTVFERVHFLLSLALCVLDAKCSYAQLVNRNVKLSMPVFVCMRVSLGVCPGNIKYEQVNKKYSTSSEKHKKERKK